MEEIRKCFFCDKIIIPVTRITTKEVSEYLKENNIAFTLNYTRFKSVIGNKILCLKCEEDVLGIISSNSYKEECDCENCKKHDNEIMNLV